jgi:hypothetical protein
MSYVLPIWGGVLTSAFKDPNDLGVTMRVTSGRVIIPLSVVRSCGREVLPKGHWT